MYISPQKKLIVFPFIRNIDHLGRDNKWTILIDHTVHNLWSAWPTIFFQNRNTKIRNIQSDRCYFHKHKHISPPHCPCPSSLTLQKNIRQKNRAIVIGRIKCVLNSAARMLITRLLKETYWAAERLINNEYNGERVQKDQPIIYL